MRNRFLVGILAFLFGSTGAHRFYLGQYFRGILYLLLPTVLAAATAFLLVQLKVSPQYDMSGYWNAFTFLLLLLYIPMILTGIIDAFVISLKKEAEFNLKYNTPPPGNTQ